MFSSRHAGILLAGWQCPTIDKNGNRSEIGNFPKGLIKWDCDRKTWQYKGYARVNCPLEIGQVRSHELRLLAIERKKNVRECTKECYKVAESTLKVDESREAHADKVGPWKAKVMVETHSDSSSSLSELPNSVPIMTSH